MTRAPPPSPDAFAEWRHAEDRFYGSVMADPDMYMAGVRLVRAVADSLGAVDDLDDLVARYDDLDVSYVSDVVRRLDQPQLALLDHHRALGAAFRLRAQEIVHRRHELEARSRIVEGKDRGDQWIVLFQEQTQRHGADFFTRVDMHLASGVGLRTANELDWERGWVYVMEPMMLDTESGRMLNDLEPPGEKREFPTIEDLEAAAATFRAQSRA